MWVEAETQDGSQMGEPSLYLWRAHHARMLQLMKADEATDPEEVGLFGTQAAVLVADSLTHLIKQPGRRGMIAMAAMRSGAARVVIPVHASDH